MSELRIISLGWGVQSFALAAMSALGELPSVDAAIHADTQHEKTRTYAFAEKWTPWLVERGVNVITVADVKAATVFYRKNGQVGLPVFTIKDSDGSKGKLRRSCTQRWKIAPQRRHISKMLKAHGLKKTPGVVEQWFGITLDEWDRMGDSHVRYVQNRYPFMEMFDPPMSRLDVMNWLDRKGLEIPPKSACVFCPFHSREQWREVRDSGNGDWQKAIDIDRLMRYKRPGYTCYVHNARVPLEEVDLRTEQEHGQLELFSEECTGYCFL